jgi:hypothetical protein
MVKALGLGYPEVKTEVPNIRGTTRDAVYFQMFFEMVRDRVLDSGLVDEKRLDAASAVLADPDYRTQCWMLTSVWAVSRWFKNGSLSPCVGLRASSGIPH